jgi:UDP-N-acetylmuramate: L-alanyl-gamma-D-glutamyl-meso-diaminopimelate ligase
MSKLPKRVHVTGICGVATSALAIAFHEKGIATTGSDKGFFPPVSTELEKHGIPFYAGWHPEKMFGGIQYTDQNLGTFATTGEDIVIVGTASGTKNPETEYAKKHGIPTYSFAEAIGKYFAKKNSIVCVGTWGKTSSSALLSFILDYANFDPTYMFGGISLSHESSAKLTDSDWSVFEGDEYKSSPVDKTAKFFYYKPTHLLITAVSWDHADLYPTEESYFSTFKKLITSTDNDGFVVACIDQNGVSKTIDNYKGKTILYGRENPSRSSQKQNTGQFYGYKNVNQTKDGLDLVIRHNGIDFGIYSPMIGLYQSENITGCFAMAHQLGVAPAIIIKAISSFKGLKRRMEKRSDTASQKDDSKSLDITVIDDIAHSPEKARSVLQTLKSIYSGKIIAIFEPNSGGRTVESAQKYDYAFRDADMVIIPHLTKLKVAAGEKTQPMEGDELASIIKKTHDTVNYIDDDAKLVEFLVSNAKKGDVIAFLGSHGFRGMIEETITCLHRQPRS